MKLPRDLSGRDLATVLAKLGYEVSRQTGSHLRLTRRAAREHHITIPDHVSLSVGTLHAIVRDLTTQLGLTRDELLRQLFG